MSQQTCLFSHDGLCHGGCTTFFDLRHDEYYKRCFPGATAIIEILLLCDDRFDQDPLPLRSAFVCSFHKEEYLTEVWLTRNKKCWLCLSQNMSRVVSIKFLLSLSASDTHIRIVQNVSTRNINPVQALFVFEHFHLRHSYGKTICHSCRNFVIEHIDAAKVKQHEKAFEWLADSDDEDKDNYKVSDSSYISSPSVASISSSSKEDKNSLDVRRKKTRST